MKIIGVYKANHSRTDDGLNILVWPDSAMIRTGKPVFIPDGKYKSVIGLGVKITAVGKSIVPKFASRYYNEMVPVFFFLPAHAADKIAMCLDPDACDIVEDYSVICGNSFAAKDKEVVMQVQITSPFDGGDIDQSLNYTIDNIQNLINEAISSASKKNTLKTGDLVVRIIQIWKEPTPDYIIKIKIGNTLLLENKLK